MRNEFVKISGIELIRYFLHKSKLIIATVAAVAIISILYALWLDNVYKSSANLFPVQERNLSLNLIGASGLGSLTGGLIGGRNRTHDRLYVLLDSYTSKMRVIEEFGLIEVYEKENDKFPITETMKELGKNTYFKGFSEGNFIIEVFDKDPERAKAMTEFYVDLVSELNIQVSVQESESYRKFIGSRYYTSVDSLESLRNSLRDFQKAYGIYELPEQIIVNLETIGQVVAQQVEAEATLSVLRETMGENNNMYQLEKIKAEVLNRELEKLFRNASGNVFLISFEELPDIASEYLKLMQDIEIEIQIQKFILPLYEQAKLEEQRALPVVNIIDAPVLAEKKVRPFRALIVIASTISGTILILLFLIVRLYLERNSKYIREFVKYDEQS
jgi:tyrosine-protein kinase Etk/Wzc